VDVGSKVVWKEREDNGPNHYYLSYFAYVPQPNSTSESQPTQSEQDNRNLFCRVDNEELYVRTSIGDVVPWQYRGTVQVKR
jgi:hypothetical protein